MTASPALLTKELESAMAKLRAKPGDLHDWGRLLSYDQAAALLQHIAALEQRVGVYERALEYLSIRRDQNHNCDDYARGYGQAKADVATFAKAALPKEPPHED